MSELPSWALWMFAALVLGPLWLLARHGIRDRRQRRSDTAGLPVWDGLSGPSNHGPGDDAMHDSGGSADSGDGGGGGGDGGGGDGGG